MLRRSLPLAAGCLAAAALFAQSPPGAPRAHPRLGLSLEEARTLFPKLRETGAAATDEYDPALWFRHRASLDLAMPHDGIPGGQWRLRTNSLGLRMDRELASQPAAITLLLVGDANMEGVCSNADSIAGRVERMLATLHPDQPIEVINAAKGGYSIYHHLLVLERFAEREPKLFAAMVCLNDLEELLAPYRHFSGTPGERVEGDAGRAYAEAAKRWPDALAQGLSTLWYFDRHPRELDEALAAAAGLYGEIAARCAALDAQLVVLWCPPYFALEREAAAAELAEPLAALGLDATALARVDGIATRLFQSLRGMRVTVIDLGPHFARRGGSMFWKSDRHLNGAANDVVAREITARCEARLLRDATRVR